MQPSQSCKNFSNFKIFENLKLFKILLSLNVKFCGVFVFVSLIIGCPSPGVCSYAAVYVVEAVHGNVISV
jgi:hypothetical protein